MNQQQVPSLDSFERRLLDVLLEDFPKTRTSGVRVPPHSPERRPNQHQRRWGLIVVTSFLLATALVVAPTLFDNPTQSALAIERRDGVLHISVRDAVADPDAMTEDLRAAGIDAEVVAVPVVPNLVGRWVEAEYDGRLADGFRPPIVNQAADHVEVLKMPADFSTWIRLKVGRAAESGEEFEDVTGFNELREHGALHCLGLPEMSPQQAEEVLSTHGYELIWVYDDGEHPNPPLTGKVYWAYFRTPNLVDIRVDTEGEAPLAHNFDPPTGIEGPCN